VAFKSVAIPWLSGGLVVFGYAAFSWLRAKRPRSYQPIAPSRHEATQPLSQHLEHVPEELALPRDSEPLPANSNALPPSADLGALFLGRVSEALSGVRFPQHRWVAHEAGAARK